MFETSEYAQERYNELVERGLRLARLAHVRAGREGAVGASRRGWLRTLLLRRVDGRATRVVSPPAATSASAR
jgi:hypothetical protein